VRIKDAAISGKSCPLRHYSNFIYQNKNKIEATTSHVKNSFMVALTRNLYREDEVIAALKWSIIQGKAEDALFWAQEATDSDMDVRLFQTLLSVWLNYVGVQNVPWLDWLITAFQNGPTEGDIVALISELAHSPKDSSVFVLQVLGISSPSTTPDYVKTFQLPENLRNLNEHETTFAKAIIQRKFEYAWNLSTPLWENGRADVILWEIEPLAVFDRLENILESIWSTEFVHPFRALAILMSGSKITFTRTVCPDPIEKYLNEWNERAALPMRKRRIMSIPIECLYWHTERGKLSSEFSTEPDIMLNWRNTLSKSPYWADKLHSSLHDTYFPSDIPDEWSSEDRKKSHGHGVQLNDVSPLRKYLSNFLTTIPSKMIWNGSERATKMLIDRWEALPPVSFEAGIMDAYTSLEVCIERWNLSAARIEYCVVSPSVM